MLALGDVEDRAVDTERLPRFVAHERGRIEDPSHLAARVYNAVFERRRLAVHEVEDGIVDAGAVVRVDPAEPEVGRRDRLVRSVAGELLYLRAVIGRNQATARDSVGI